MGAQVEIVSESERPQGWAFVAQVLDDAGTLRRHDITLSWADYNLWSSSGSDEPARVAAAVLRFLLRHDPPETLRPSFDASLARRQHPEADREIPGWI